jgi:hypothetical protein
VKSMRDMSDKRDKPPGPLLFCEKYARYER